MYIAIVGHGPDVANKGVFSRSCFYFLWGIPAKIRHYYKRC